MRGRSGVKLLVGFILVLTLMSFVSAGLFDFFTGNVVENCQGCLVDNECLQVGDRDGINFCTEGEYMGRQLADGAVCDSSFECASNGCINSICVEEGSVENCQGCLVDNECLQVGDRDGINFCTEGEYMGRQLADGAVCDSSFECASNGCINSICVEESLDFCDDADEDCIEEEVLEDINNNFFYFLDNPNLFNYSEVKCPGECILKNNHYIPILNSYYFDKINISQYLSEEILLDRNISITSWYDYGPMSSKVKELVSGEVSQYNKANKILNWVKKSQYYCDDHIFNSECVSVVNDFVAKSERDIRDNNIYHDIFESDSGVCFDAAILALGMLRRAGIPADYNFVGPEHIDIFLLVEDKWYIADPTFGTQDVELISLEKENRGFSRVIFNNYEKSIICDEGECFNESNYEYIVKNNFDYISEEQSDVFLPNKVIMSNSMEFDGFYNCNFYVGEVYNDNYGYSKDMTNEEDYSEISLWSQIPNGILYDYGILEEHSGVGYNHHRVPGNMWYKYTCEYNGYNGIDTRTIFDYYFRPSAGEKFILKLEYLLDVNYTSKDHFDRIMNLLSEDLYLEEVLQVLSGEKATNININLGAKSISSDKSNSLPDSNQSLNSITCDNGCILNNKCLPYGYRDSGEFCSTNNKMISQQYEETVCENNFECNSNLCVDSACVEAGLWQKIVNWFSRLF